MNYNAISRPRDTRQHHYRKGSLDSYEQQRRQNWHYTQRKSSLPESFQKQQKQWNRQLVQAPLYEESSGTVKSQDSKYSDPRIYKNPQPYRKPSAATAYSTTSNSSKPHSVFQSIVINLAQLTIIASCFTVFFFTYFTSICTSLPSYSSKNYSLLKAQCASADRDEATCKSLNAINNSVYLPDFVSHCNKTNLAFSLVMYACLIIFALRLICASVWHFKFNRQRLDGPVPLASAFFNFLSNSSWSQVAARVAFVYPKRQFLYNFLLVIHVTTLIFAPTFTLLSCLALVRGVWNALYYAPSLSANFASINDLLYITILGALIATHLLTVVFMPGFRYLESAFVYYIFFLPYYGFYCHFRAAWRKIRVCNSVFRHKLALSPAIQPARKKSGPTAFQPYDRKSSLSSQGSQASHSSSRSGRTLNNSPPVNFHKDYNYQPQHMPSLPQQAYFPDSSFQQPVYETQPFMVNENKFKRISRYLSSKVSSVMGRPMHEPMLPTLKSTSTNNQPSLTHEEHETIRGLPNPNSFPVPEYAKPQQNEDALTILTVKSADTNSKRSTHYTDAKPGSYVPTVDTMQSVADAASPTDLEYQVEERMEMLDNNLSTPKTRFSTAASTILPEHSVSRRNSAVYLQPQTSVKQSYGKNRYTAATVRDSKLYS